MKGVLIDCLFIYFKWTLIHIFFFLARVPPQIKRPNREVKPLRRESPGLQPRGPVGRAHPISKSEKPASSRERESRAKGRDDKVRTVGARRGSGCCVIRQKEWDSFINKRTKV